jgi:hypothetical protein
MTIRIIDIETTGTDPANDMIVEIASVDLLRDGTITNRMSTLVRPAIPVPPESSAVHHLIGADLASAPRLKDVLDQFKGADAYVAHNADSSALSWRTSWAMPYGPAPTNARCASGRTSSRTRTRRCATAWDSSTPSGSTATR